MDITKEQFIELFNKACGKALENGLPDSFKKTGVITNACSFEVVLDGQPISLLVSKDLIDDGRNIYDLTGKIIFQGFVVYKKFDISIEEFEAMEDMYTDNQIQTTLNDRNRIIDNFEKTLESYL